MKNYIKAAYIFSILPQYIKSHCLTVFTEQEKRNLEKGLLEINTLPLKLKTKILTEFIYSVESLRIHQRHLFDISIGISFIIFCIIIGVSMIVSNGWINSVRTCIYILQYGGVHALLAPFVINYARRLTQQSLKTLCIPKHIIPDLCIGITASIAMIIIFAFSMPNEPLTVTKASFVALFFAITAVPCTEELFFRGVIFLHGGSKYGYFASWFFSSFLFASIHLPHTPVEFTAYFLCSSILCGIAYTFSLFACIVAHMLFNGFLFFM